MVDLRQLDRCPSGDVVEEELGVVVAVAVVVVVAVAVAEVESLRWQWRTQAPQIVAFPIAGA